MSRSHSPYLVRLSHGKVQQTHLWDDATPQPLGSPMRYVLERMPSGGVRVRDLKNGTAQGLSEGTLKGGAVVQLESFGLQLLPVRSLTAPYAQAAKGTDIYLYSGLRHTLLSMQPLGSAYVAYSKGKPIFTVQKDAQDYKIKAMLAGLRVKKKGGSLDPVPAGEFVRLTRDEFLTCTLTRGWSWWKFGAIQAPAEIADTPATLSLEEETERRWFKRTAAALLLLLLLGGAATFLVPQLQEESVENKPAEPIVRMIPKLRKAPRISAKLAPITQAPTDPGPTKKPSTPTPKAEQTAAKPAGSPKKAPTPQSDAKALAQVKSLKALLGGLSTNLGKANIKAESSAAARTSKAVLGGNTPSLAQTDIRPAFGGTAAKVDRLGGGGTGGGAAGGSGSANVGYGSGGVNAATGAGSGFVSVDFGTPTVDEGLTKEEVGAVIHAHMSEVRYCHEASLVRNPKLEGKLMLAFKINARGVVQTAAVQSSNLSDSKLDQCIVQRLKTWQFPEPKGGVTVSVTYPFLFKTLRRD